MVDAIIAIYNRTIIFFSLPFHFFLLPFYFLFLISCEKQTTPVTLPNPQLTLTVEDVAVTEAWLRLGAQETAAEQQIIIWRDSSEIYNLSGAIADTTIHDSALFPAHNYTYRAELRKNGQKIVGADPVSITTMDTTSHNFQWEIFEFGGVHGSSVLYDVAIVNENDIWAVGEIHTAETDTFDSLGNWVPPYNAVHWDGLDWELRRFMVPGPGFGEIYSVFAFGPNDVWMGQGSARHWDGQQWIIYNSNNGFPGAFRVRKIWGTSSENLYFVGEEGNIVHYNGQNWRQMGYGLEVDMHDIWGAINPQTGEWEILIVGSKAFQVNHAKMLLRVEGQYLKTVPDSGLAWTVTGLWFMPGKRYYVVGDGVFSIRHLGEIWQANGTHPLLYKSAIRGNDINDILIVGAFGLVSHFNGISWHHYAGSAWPLFDGYYGEVAYKGNLMVAVGQIGNKGLILRGWRQ